MLFRLRGEGKSKENRPSGRSDSLKPEGLQKYGVKRTEMGGNKGVTGMLGEGGRRWRFAKAKDRTGPCRLFIALNSMLSAVEAITGF